MNFLIQSNCRGNTARVSLHEFNRKGRESSNPGKHCCHIGLITVLLLACNFKSSSAQYDLPTSSGNLRQHSAFKNLPLSVKPLVDSAIKHYNDPDPEKSIADLRKILDLDVHDQYKSLFRAWVYQWLAFNYDLLKKADSVKTYVILSTKKNTEIWHDYKYFRIPEGVQETFQEYWQEIIDGFNNKSKSLRFAAGTITRADYSQRFIEHWDIVAGVGTTVVLFEEIKKIVEDNNDDSRFFKEMLFYARVQRMRKSIQRFSAGFYFEFSLLADSEDLFSKNLFQPGVHFKKNVSGGTILSYAKQSGWELGGTFEILRLVFGRDTTTEISQTAFKGDLSFSYANFEFYLRKWF